VLRLYTDGELRAEETKKFGTTYQLYKFDKKINIDNSN
jgi:hypothetical protein